MMCKERLSTAHCGGANHGCARLPCMQPTCLFVLASRDAELDAHTDVVLRTMVMIDK